MLLKIIILAFLNSDTAALYFPNAAVLTHRDIGRQISLNLSGSYLAYATYNYETAEDDAFVQRIRVVSIGNSVNVLNLSGQLNATGQLIPTNFTSPITVINDNVGSSQNATQFVVYFVRTNVTPIFPVYSLVNGSATVTSDPTAPGLTILSAKPSVIASSFSLKSVPIVRVASCGYDSATSEDYAVLDISSQRQSFSFHILNGPIATFYDPKTSNGSFSFSLSEATGLDRSVASGAEFTITSAGFATINSSYNVEQGLTLKQNYDFGRDTLTQIVIDASDFRDGEKIRFIASGSKKSLDISLNATGTIYEPAVSASTIALTVTGTDPSHSPRFSVKVVSCTAHFAFTVTLLTLILLEFI